MAWSSFSDERPNRAGAHSQLGLELLDMQGLGVDLGVAGSDRPIPLRKLGLQNGHGAPAARRDRRAGPG